MCNDGGPGSVFYTDPDGATAFEYSYAWTVDGSAASSITNTLDTSALSKGQIVRCFATPNDGTDAGDPVGSNSVEILNTAPTVVSVTICDGARPRLFSFYLTS